MATGESTPKISIDHKKCSGCRICEQICVFFHEREFNPRRARIKILMREKEGIYAPLLCIQCKTCISSCNRDALSWDDKVGVVRVDAEKCNGCGLCIAACEQGSISLDPISGIVNICDLCDGNPQCVRWCSQEALRYEAV
ncbi:4Fe-4S dicluster domain-containing protein [Thermodesulfobacteriota bacterium]